MKFTHNNQEYRIVFAHVFEKLTKEERQRWENKFKHRMSKTNAVPKEKHVTLCNVGTWDEATKVFTVINTGHSQTHPNDNFYKETGRKIALTRALDHFYFNNETGNHAEQKELRRAFWNCYLKRVDPSKIKVKPARKLYKVQE